MTFLSSLIRCETDAKDGACPHVFATIAEGGGYDPELFAVQEQDMNKDLICGICLKVLNTPMSVCRKGHTYCLDCIEAYEQHSGGTTCPQCREDISSEKHLNLIVHNMIMNLHIRCPNNNSSCSSITVKSNTNDDDSNVGKSCDWEGTLEQYISSHKDHQCPYRLVECPLGCGSNVLSHDVATHTESKCPNRMVECQFCREQVMFSNLTAHQNESCPEMKVSCEYCGEEMTRRQLGKKPTTTTHCEDLLGTTRLYSGHYRVCPKMPVLCRYYKFGCQHSFLREHSARHHKEFQTKHLSLLENNVQALWVVNPRIRLRVSLAIPILDEIKQNDGDVDVASSVSSFCLKGKNHKVDGHNVFPILTLIDGIIHARVHLQYACESSAPYVYRAYFTLVNKLTRNGTTHTRACLVLPTH